MSSGSHRKGSESGGGDLERDLVAMRPEPPPELVNSIVREAGPRRSRLRAAPRVAFAAALTVGLLAAVASFGGISSAANRISEWGTAVTHVAAGHSASPGPKLAATAAAAQYQPAVASSVAEGPRAGYCSVAGDTYPDGTPIPVGTFLNLALGQPAVDPEYAGAKPAFYIQGIGITCDTPSSAYSPSNIGPVDALGQPNPPGIMLPGNIYPYYTPTAG